STSVSMRWMTGKKLSTMSSLKEHMLVCIPPLTSLTVTAWRIEHGPNLHQRVADPVDAESNKNFQQRNSLSNVGGVAIGREAEAKRALAVNNGIDVERLILLVAIFVNNLVESPETGEVVGREKLNLLP